MDRLKFVIINLLLERILPAVSPALRATLAEYAAAFYFKARETDNPLDDVLAKFILDVLDLPEPDQNPS
jgi:hypothetical protein